MFAYFTYHLHIQHNKLNFFMENIKLPLEDINFK